MASAGIFYILQESREAGWRVTRLVEFRISLSLPFCRDPRLEAPTRHRRYNHAVLGLVARRSVNSQQSARDLRTGSQAHIVIGPNVVIRRPIPMVYHGGVCETIQD